MSEMAMDTNRVDLYVKGQLNAEEAMAFEAELLESPRLQEALENVLSLQRVLNIEQRLGEAGIIDPPVTNTPRWRRLPDVRSWSMAASILLLVGVAVLLWRSEVENAQLQSQLSMLSQPVGSVLTVRLDIMRSAPYATPDVRIRKMPGPSLLVLDVEVTSSIAEARVVELQLLNDKGDELASWTAPPAKDSRIQIALRSDHLPEGLVSLKISNPDAGTSENRILELLPPEK